MSKKKNYNVDENVTENEVVESAENTEEVTEGVIEETSGEVTFEQLPEITEEVVVKERVNTPVKEEKKEEVKPTVVPVVKPMVEIAGKFYLTLGRVPEHRINNVTERLARVNLTPVTKGKDTMVGPFDTRVEALAVRKNVIANGVPGRIVEL